MNDSPLFLLGKLTAKFERLDDLLAEFMVNSPRSGIDPLSLLIPICPYPSLLVPTKEPIEVQTDNPYFVDGRWRDIQDVQRSIDADLERLAALYANPLQQIQNIAEEHRNKYLEFTKELNPVKPESLR